MGVHITVKSAYTKPDVSVVIQLPSSVVRCFGTGDDDVKKEKCCVF